MDFKDTVIVVTGASKGLGKILSEILSKYKANVVGVYNSTKIDTKLFDTFKCDIQKENDVIKLYQYIKSKYKKLDVVINCAAYSDDADIFEKSVKSFKRVIDINLVGTFLMCKYALFDINDGGVIINVSSTDAFDTYNPLSMDYAASKAGVENLTKNLAKRFPKIKICAIAPAWIDTDTVLNMEPNFLQEELKRNNQKELLKKENVALKIIEMIVNNDDYVSGEIVRVDKNE